MLIINNDICVDCRLLQNDGDLNETICCGLNDFWSQLVDRPFKLRIS